MFGLQGQNSNKDNEVSMQERVTARNVAEAFELEGMGTGSDSPRGIGSIVAGRMAGCHYSRRSTKQRSGRLFLLLRLIDWRNAGASTCRAQ